MSENRAHSPEITLVLADDHAVVRKGLRLLIEAEPGLRVVAEAGTIPDALDAARAHRPTVVVLDLNMPGGSGFTAIRSMTEQVPDTAIVILTMQHDLPSARRALEAGALGFVLKEAADDELLSAIRLAAERETYLDSHVGARFAALASKPDGRPAGLSDRELEVLTLIALGHTNPEIASHLHVSVRTVESHRAHIQGKTRKSTRAELVRFCIQHGLVQLLLDP